MANSVKTGGAKLWVYGHESDYDCQVTEEKFFHLINFFTKSRLYMGIPSRRLNRREFLKSLSAVTVGMAVIPWGNLQNRFPVPQANGISLRVGVAIPAYLKDRRRASQWLTGLRFGLSKVLGATLIPYTADDRMKSVMDTLENLVKVAQADVIVGSVSPFASTQIAYALAGTSAVFLNTDVGANLTFPSMMRENVFHHTLHYWQSSWATGTWAAKTYGKRGVILATFHEAGFDALAAFQLAFEEAGGEVLRTVITHNPTETWRPQETLARLAALKPDFVYLMGMGEQAAELQSAFQSSPMAGRVPLLKSGFAQTKGTRPAGLAEFARLYQTETGERSEAMSLLGYETGLLIHAARQTMAQTGVTLAQALSTASIESPRGQVSMDAEVHATQAGAFVDGEANALEHLAAIDARTARLHPGWSEIRTGWITPYFSL